MGSVKRGPAMWALTQAVDLEQVVVAQISFDSLSAALRPILIRSTR